MPSEQTPKHDVTLKFTAIELSGELHALARTLASNEKTAILAPQVRGAADIIHSIYKELR